MAGLLDSMDDPRTMGLLSLGLGLLNSRGNFGQALGQAGPQALQAMQQVKDRQLMMQDRQQQQKMRDLQMQQAQAQLAEMQRAAAERQKLSDLAAQSVLTPEQVAMRANGGPTMAASQAAQTAQPDFDWKRYATGVAGVNPMMALQIQQAMQKDETPIVLPDGSILATRAGKKLLENPKQATPTDLSKLLSEMNALPQGSPLRATYLDAIKKATTHTPAAQVNVNTDSLGLKPKDKFEMEQKLSADYGTATKMDRSIISTAEDISNILKQGGALKDQAAIYKFAKALDPDGAVREADYAAIVRTAGGVDYVKALVNKALTGEQLLPKQREEMTRVVNAMADVARSRIGQTQRKTAANAKLYNLNPDNIFSTADNDGWAILPGGK